MRDSRPCADPTPPAVWFAYSPDRRGEHPQGHFKLYRGALQADAYAGFHPLYEDGSILEVACWAHARRKFHEIHLAHASPTTTKAIERIAALYAIEAEIRGSTPEIRQAIRQARPLLDALRSWLELMLARLSRKSDTAAAIRYALSRWIALTRYVDDGQLEIDNNTAERALRVVAWDAKTSSSPVQMPEDNAPPPSTRCSAQPSSTAWTRSFTSTMSSNASQITQSTRSAIFCPGTSLYLPTHAVHK